MRGLCLATDLDPRAGMHAAVIFEDLIVIGTGRGPNGISSKMYLMNSKTSELSIIRAPEAMHPRQNYAMCALPDLQGLLLHGGSNLKMGCLNDSSFFYYLYIIRGVLRASRVRLQNHQICPRQLHSCCSIGNNFVALAGGKDKSYAPLYDIYVIDISTGYCQKLDTTIPDGLTDFSLMYYDEQILFIGGLIDGKTPSAAIYRYHLDNCTWKKWPMPHPLYRHSSFLWREYLVNIFGFTEEGSPAKELLIYNMSLNQWFTSLNHEAANPNLSSDKKKVPHRCSFASAVCGDNLFIYGGLDKGGNHLSDLWVVPLKLYVLSDAAIKIESASSTTPEFIAQGHDNSLSPI